MEKTLRKCGSSSGGLSQNQINITSLPFVIPKRFQLTKEHIPGMEYVLDQQRFQYHFGTEETVLTERETRLQREREEEAEAARVAAEAAESVAQETEGEGTPVTFPVTSEMLVPVTIRSDSITTTTTTQNRPTVGPSNHLDFINDFDNQNTNPFDGVELQSLSDFDALRSVLEIPSNTIHREFAAVTIDDTTPTNTFGNGEEKEENVEPAPDATLPTLSATNPFANHTDPVYSTVGPKDTPPPYPDPAHQPLPAYEPAPEPKPQPVPEPARAPQPAPPAQCLLPDDLVARVMSENNFNEEQSMLKLQAIMDLRDRNQCDLDVAEAAVKLEKGEGEFITLVKQFIELGFNKTDVLEGVAVFPDDRDSLLDFLILKSNS